MKKLLLLATFAVAGVISAKDNSVTKTEIKKAVAFSCVPVSYSCGVSGYACGDTVQEMLTNAWDGDALFCG